MSSLNKPAYKSEPLHILVNIKKAHTHRHPPVAYTLLDHINEYKKLNFLKEKKGAAVAVAVAVAVAGVVVVVTTMKTNTQINAKALSTYVYGCMEKPGQLKKRSIEYST